MRHLRDRAQQMSVRARAVLVALISLAAMVALLGLLSLLLSSSFVFRDWLERRVMPGVEIALPELPLATTSVPKVATSTTQAHMPLRDAEKPLFDLFRHESPSASGVSTSSFLGEGGLVYDVFIDLLSGTGWIDEAKTTLYQDAAETAFMLPPKFTFEKSSFSQTSSFIERDAQGGDSHCIARETKACLVRRGLALTFNGQPLELPAEVRESAVMGVSIGSLSTMWPVGVIVKSGDVYSGFIFLFDGKTFKNIAQEGGAVFTSSYRGPIGFGGEDADWVAVYGVHEGRAVHVRRGTLTDISHLFGTRIMGEGFDPAVLRMDNGGIVTWYVGSRGGAPKLMKLFESTVGSIVGAVDFSSSLAARVPAGASFEFAPSVTPHALEVRVGGSEYWKFTDQGFDNTSTREVISIDIAHRALPVRYAVIAHATLSDEHGAVTFFLSQDALTWKPVRVGERVDFTSGNKLFWRAEVRPSHNEYATPFLDSVEVDFAFQRGE